MRPARDGAPASPEEAAAHHALLLAARAERTARRTGYGGIAAERCALVARNERPRPLCRPMLDAVRSRPRRTADPPAVVFYRPA